VIMDDHTPLEPEQLDELLSAELDGELDSAARDLGMTVDEAGARLRVTPGAAARRQALASARDLLGAPVELDEITAARLRGDALRGSQPVRRADPARRHQVWWATGVVAASVALIVALLAGVGISGHDSESKSGSAIVAAPATTAAGTAKSVNGSLAAPALGTFADPATLAQVALGRAGAPPTATNALRKSAYQNATETPNTPAAAADSGKTTSTSNNQVSLGADAPNPSTSTTAHSPRTPAADNPGASSASSAAACPTPNVNAVAAGAVLRLRATATLGGNPVAIWVFSAAKGYVVAIDAVSAGGKCSLLSIQTTG
jgi:hypothetical protein